MSKRDTPHLLFLLAFIVGIVLLLTLSILLRADNRERDEFHNELGLNFSEARVCFHSSNCLNVALARTPEQRRKGLMFVESLPRNAGMLFVFERSAKHGFWMKNTLLALDIIWINSSLDVVDFKTAEPCKSEQCKIYYPNSEAKYVVEASAGFAAKANLKLGDKARVIF
ncbi:DUF192 domain-containing protein [Candidatus Pacearchaeota archaeon]|nr:MAG: DUF192 domain-containing protein [Candidatus Pacearchaeota archaeon]